MSEEEFSEKMRRYVAADEFYQFYTAVAPVPEPTALAAWSVLGGIGLASG